jgi:hypothetical protein
LIEGSALTAALLPTTGVAFILYTYYMVTDPATTPSRPIPQIVFGAAVAAAYGVLLLAHVVFGLFFALTIVCTLRGIGLYAHNFIAHRAKAKDVSNAPTRIAAVSKEI